MTDDTAPSPSPGEAHPDELKTLVREGYDQIAQRYLEWTTNSSTPRVYYLEKLLTLLAPKSAVLELGCGAGTPGTRMLAENHHAVTANDISDTQIALAQENAPSTAEFIRADMMALTFPLETFDAVVALFCVFHLPRAEQGILIQRVSTWLRPGGYFLLNLGSSDDPGSVASDWLGGKMYWSGFDAVANQEMVRRAGFDDVDVQIIGQEEGEETIQFLWMLVRKR